jgi:hypothetical protein
VSIPDPSATAANPSTNTIGAAERPSPGGEETSRGSSSDASSATDTATPGSGRVRNSLDRLTVQPPSWFDRALEAAIVATKAATVACAIDGFVNASSPRLRGKGIRTRAIGYVGGLLIVPLAWRLLPNSGRYPRGLDLAVTVPLLIDAGGNALGLYQDAHLDDVVHLLNAAIVSGIAGAVFATQTDEPWQAALAGTGTAIAGETAWEIVEWLGLKAGAKGMDLTYDDTMADLAESALGAVIGGVVTWLRMPRDPVERRRGWRHAVAGWREAGEPVSLLGGRNTVGRQAIDRAAARTAAG